jgi:hypothetical protein
MYNPFFPPKGNPNFNHMYMEQYQVDLSSCTQVTANIEIVDRNITMKEVFWVTSLDKAEEEINQVMEHFNATLRYGESSRKFIGFKDIVIYKSEYGLIDREGKYYPCEFGEHNVLSEQIIKDNNWYDDFLKYCTKIKGSFTDYLVLKRLWGLRHNPTMDGTPFLKCERPTEAIEKTNEDI